MGQGAGGRGQERLRVKRTTDYGRWEKRREGKKQNSHGARRNRNFFATDEAQRGRTTTEKGGYWEYKVQEV